MTEQRKQAFEAVAHVTPGIWNIPGAIALMDQLYDLVDAQDPPTRQVSSKGIELMHRWESCKLDAYPDPGSKDGHPWTIGWGSTGPGIHKGVTWSKKQCDERFAQDLQKYADKVSEILGDTPTTQEQFDALVSLGYNIGTGGLAKSTVMRKHKAGDYEGAAKAFALWNKNDGKVMKGLTNRRADEAALYRSGS